jgi:hypothetical protein
VVYVLWLEVLGQRDLAAKMTRLMSAGDCSDAHQEAIGRYLRLLGAKVNMGKCYIQLQRHEERKWQLSPDPIRNRTGQG